MKYEDYKRRKQSLVIIKINMDDSIAIQNNDIQPIPSGEPGADLTSRRDFLKLSAILTGSAILVLNRLGTFEQFNFPLNQTAPPLAQDLYPPNFKRFVLTRGGPELDPGEMKIAAYGSQCPDNNCALLWVDRPDFQFYNDVQEILDLYTQDGMTDLLWLD